MILLDGSPDSAEPYRRFTTRTTKHFPLREGVRDDISIFGLTIKANVGFADLTERDLLFRTSRTYVQLQDASRIHFITRIATVPVR